MSPDDVKGLNDILTTGGNSALVVLAFLAWKIANLFRDLLIQIKDEIIKSRVETTAELESIKRAMVAEVPERAKIFERLSNAGG